MSPEAERTQPKLFREPTRPFLRIGHRGFPAVAPENTIASFKKAVEVGVDMIEFDVVLSKDHVPIVLHDRTLNRTTNGKGSPKHKTLSQLKELDAGSWFSNEFKHEALPTLS